MTAHTFPCPVCGSRTCNHLLRARGITWKRIPRQGFIASHWIGTDPDGVVRWKIEQRKPPGRMNRTRYAILWPMPNGKGREFDSVPDAKAGIHREAIHGVKA